jgi:hypothetical protein
MLRVVLMAVLMAVMTALQHVESRNDGRAASIKLT